VILQDLRIEVRLNGRRERRVRQVEEDVRGRVVGVEVMRKSEDRILAWSLLIRIARRGSRRGGVGERAGAFGSGGRLEDAPGRG
jgi:hypothetical protein